MMGCLALASILLAAAGFLEVGAAAAPAPAPPTCTAPPQENSCISSGSKRCLQKKEGTTAAACCASCEATAGCTAWSLWEKGDPRDSFATTECGLYAFSDPPPLKPGPCTTGIAPPPRPPPTPPTYAKCGAVGARDLGLILERERVLI